MSGLSGVAQSIQIAECKKFEVIKQLVVSFENENLEP